MPVVCLSELLRVCLNACNKWSKLLDDLTAEAVQTSDAGAVPCMLT